MRKSIVILAAIVLIAGSISMVRADAGKNVFTNKCCSCHRAGGEAAAVSPSKYAGIQWQRFFDKNKHAKKKDIQDQFSPADLAEVKDYLVSHAADSDQPETLGVR